MKPLYLYRVHLASYRQSTRNYLLPAFNRADAIEKARKANPGCHITQCDCEAPPETAFLIHRAAL